MNQVVYIFGGGLAFFLGAGLILFAALLRSLFHEHSPRAIVNIFTLVGIVFVVLAATPLSTVYFVAAYAITILWFVSEDFQIDRLRARRGWLRALVMAIWLLGLGLEAPYQISPKVTAAGKPDLYVLGDSVTAGVREGDQDTWPNLLSQAHSVEVHDFSKMGATTRLALQQAEQLPASGGLVLLEIGGNDLLGNTSAAQFELDLERLLTNVCVPGRTVLMFELPLPPFCSSFGNAQRRLAARHGVLLIPKRIFADVLSSRPATLDGIHLTPEGHARMAEVVWELIGPAYGQ